MLKIIVMNSLLVTNPLVYFGGGMSQIGKQNIDLLVIFKKKNITQNFVF